VVKSITRKPLLFLQTLSQQHVCSRRGFSRLKLRELSGLKGAISASALRIFLAEVTYVDWSRAPFDNNPLVMCFRKDSSYEHEKEVRAVIWDVDVIGENMSDALLSARTRTDYPNSGMDPFILQKTDGRMGIEVSFDPARFITEVVIGPRETHTIAGLVECILNRYGLKTKVTISDRLRPRR
jgi:hypothetical protein